MRTQYINTDLDLEGGADLQDLVRALESGGLFTLNLIELGDQWRANLEMGGCGETEKDPTVTITAMLDAIAAVDASTSAIWQRCRKREFNMGIQCGSEPHSTEYRLPNDLLVRVANAGASVGVTLYVYTNTD
jgi:hypothetical protein